MQSLLALTALLLTAVPDSEPAVVRGPVTERVVIVAHGPQPPDSGVFAWYRDIEAVNERGESLSLAVLWLGDGQKLPAVGAVCKVEYRLASLANKVDKDGQPVIRNVIDSFDCLSGA